MFAPCATFVNEESWAVEWGECSGKFYVNNGILSMNVLPLSPQVYRAIALLCTFVSECVFLISSLPFRSVADFRPRVSRLSRGWRLRTEGSPTRAKFPCSGDLGQGLFDIANNKAFAESWRTRSMPTQNAKPAGKCVKCSVCNKGWNLRAGLLC